MKKYFTYYVKKMHGIEIKTNNFFNYPIIMKNYISNNLYFGGLFLKHDLDFFTSHYFSISHPYYKDMLKESIQKRIFPKISDQDDINKFLSYDTCKMINEIYACKLNALAFSSSFNNYENTINVIYSNIMQINIAFFSYKICKNCLFGKKKIILEFIKNLNPQFNCSISKDNLCYFCDPIDNKIGFFIFGNSGIKFEKLILNIDEELDDYLYFSFHTIENLGFIIDQEGEKIIFTSNSPDIIISKKSSSKIKTIVFILFIEWIIIILYIICNKAY